MLLAGDFVPNALNVQLPEQFRQELVLANLEGPICANDLQESNKVGPCLFSEPFEIPGCWAFVLANNHMMDFREEGLLQTIFFLKENSYKYAGAGKDVEEARKPLIINEKGIRIAIFSCCEKQFGVASSSQAGCAEMGLWLISAIKDVKNNDVADRVIVSCHAASEFSPWISPKLRSFYHSLIDAGADCIHGHHSHVPQGYEVYKDNPIFYGLGNFAVDVDEWAKNPNQLWSVAVNIEFKEDKIAWSPMFVGVKKVEGALQVFFLDGEHLEKAKRYIDMANEQFENNEMCLACWQEASIALYPKIYAPNTRIWFSVRHKIPFRERFKLIYFAGMDILSALTGRSLPECRSLFSAKVAYNIYCCPSHTDMISTYLGVTSGVEKDLRSWRTKVLAKGLGLC